MKHFDLFSGYGGFSLALEKVYGNNTSSEKQMPEQKSLQSDGDLLHSTSEGNGEDRNEHATTIGFSEIDKYASAVLKYHWPNTKNYGDITKINWSEVPDFDLLTGGSPCQDLSIAGKRAGLEGARSGLFYEYMRAVKEKRPKYFIWENVKGALSSNKGLDLGAVLNEMAKEGYSLWWQVLNAKDFSVPQNRERIFVVGFRDGSPREIFFERGNNEEVSSKVHPCIDANYYKGHSNQRQMMEIKQLNNPKHSNDRIYSEEGISPSLNTAQGGNRQPFIDKPPRIRRLTPTECERLMGLPDNWLKYGIDEKGNQFEVSDSQKYKMAGNGVVVNVVEELIKQIIL